MRCLIDGDVIRYEIGFAAEIGWKAKTGRDELPSFDFVEELLLSRINMIMRECEADEATIYLSKGKNFRHDVATVKPYKGTRIPNKPFHFANLTAYMIGQLEAKVVEFLEADDMLAIDSLSSVNPTIIASRDKDLRSIPGWSYSWELGRQVKFGPELITKEGYLRLDKSGKQAKLKGTGLSFFYAQLLMGDVVDNILGCRGVGPVAAYALLADKSPDEQLDAVVQEYKKVYGDDWEKMMTENGQLTWIIRKLDQHQQPVMWAIGMTE